MNASSHPEFPVGGVRFISNCCVYRTASQHLRPDEKARHVELILLVTLKAFVTGHSLSSQRTRSRVSGRSSRSPCGSVARHSGWIARDASSSMRLCSHARIIVSHLSLSLSVHCACFVATRLRPALPACNYCVLRTPNRKFPPTRPHEVGVGGACRLGSLNGADQPPTAQGRLLA